MHWAAHPVLYQLTHLWHWLGYGQNAAILGILGLALYVLFTYQLTRVTEETRRLTLTPYLIASLTQKDARICASVINVAAPAVSCYVTHYHTTDRFVSNGLALPQVPLDHPPRFEAAILAGGGPLLLPFLSFKSVPNQLFILRFKDTAGENYQLLILVKAQNLSHGYLQSNFISPMSLEPFFRRWKIRVVQVLRARELRKQVVGTVKQPMRANSLAPRSSAFTWEVPRNRKL